MSEISDEAVERLAKAAHDVRHPFFPWQRMSEAHRADYRNSARAVLMEGSKPDAAGKEPADGS